MMTWSDLLRRAGLRSLAEAAVQRVRVEVHGADAKDNAERWQDYGFAAHPVDGQGLVLHVAGHTIVLRMDRLGERPPLQPYDVSVWHKEGHCVTLKAGRLVQVDCDQLTINASTGVTITTPAVSMSGNLIVSGTATGVVDVVGGGKSLKGHVHTSAPAGDPTSAPN
jgi:phage gp45-like